MKILICRDLSFVIDIQYKGIIEEAIKKQGCNNEIDVSKSGNFLIIEGLSFNMLCLLHDLSTNYKIEIM